MIRIDGTITSIAERESRINKFQTDSSYSVFLLTTQVCYFFNQILWIESWVIYWIIFHFVKVGGVGLTLTAADRVVISKLCSHTYTCCMKTHFFSEEEYCVQDMWCRIVKSLCFILVDPSWNPATDAQAVDRFASFYAFCCFLISLCSYLNSIEWGRIQIFSM
jgi:hypothetical protein